MTGQTTADQPATRRARTIITTSQLRGLLTVDAIGCLALGVVGVAAAGALEELLGADEIVLVVVGLALLAYAVEAAFVARRPDRRGLLVLALLNAGFALGAAVVAVTAGLTGYGVAVAVALAAVSLVVAELLMIARRDLRAS